MAADPINPFGVPGLGAAGSSNPLVASLELMQNALNSFGQSASMAGAPMAQTLNPEDLEKRISELKAVENWLKLNLTMLSSSIQGMEVQLATIRTLRSFVEMGTKTATSADQPSPLEVVLGIRKPAAATGTESGHGDDQQSSVDAKAQPKDDSSDPNTEAAKVWWNVLQDQFLKIAQATSQAASMVKQSVPETAAPASSTKVAKDADAKPSKTISKRKPRTAKTSRKTEG